MQAAQVNALKRVIVVLGSRSVGKSSLVYRFIDEFSGDIRFAFYDRTFTKRIRHKGTIYDCEIIDTVGLDEPSIKNIKSIPMAHGCVILYSVTSRRSFEMIQIVYNEIISKNGVTKVPCVIAGTKVDLLNQRQVSENEGRQLAESNRAAWLELSTMNDTNVGEIFASCLDQIEANDIVETEHTPRARTHSLTPPHLPQLSDVDSPVIFPETYEILEIPPMGKGHEETLSIVTESNSNSELPDLTGLLIRLKMFASAFGGFADVWEAKWGDVKVAVKVLRPPLEDEEAKGKLKKRLRRELRVWRNLSHRNVLPLFGVASDFGQYTSMVCPWMANGTLNTYLERFKTTPSLSRKFVLLNQVVDGLSYLHSRDVIHGDLTGSNILIDDKGIAFLSDFGLSTIVAEFQGTSYFTSNIRGAVRYAAPEIYAVSNTQNSPTECVSVHSDVYSFGSIMLQTLSGRVPYHYLRNDAIVLLEVHNGRPHQRPPEKWFTDSYWEFINKCWDGTPHNRPTMEEIISYVRSCELDAADRSRTVSPSHIRHPSIKAIVFASDKPDAEESAEVATVGDTWIQL